jgi:hypothetical protein
MQFLLPLQILDKVYSFLYYNWLIYYVGRTYYQKGTNRLNGQK